MQGLLTLLGILALPAFAFFQLVLGYLGIEYHLGMWWGIAGLAVGLIFRFTLPLTIGVYFGAVDVLDWHWLVGLLVAVPGLVFVIPGFIAWALEEFRSAIGNRNG